MHNIIFFILSLNININLIFLIVNMFNNLFYCFFMGQSVKPYMPRVGYNQLWTTIFTHHFSNIYYPLLLKKCELVLFFLKYFFLFQQNFFFSQEKFIKKNFVKIKKKKYFFFQSIQYKKYSFIWYKLWRCRVQRYVVNKFFNLLNIDYAYTRIFWFKYKQWLMGYWFFTDTNQVVIFKKDAPLLIKLKRYFVNFQLTKYNIFVLYKQWFNKYLTKYIY